jgi:hypothetical protein
MTAKLLREDDGASLPALDISVYRAQQFHLGKPLNGG